MNIPKIIFDTNFPSDNLPLSDFPQSIRQKGQQTANLIEHMLKSHTSNDFGNAEVFYPELPFIHITGSDILDQGMYSRLTNNIWCSGFPVKELLSFNLVPDSRVWLEGRAYVLHLINNKTVEGQSTSSYVWHLEKDIKPNVSFDFSSFEGSSQGNISSVIGSNILNIKGASNSSFLPQILDMSGIGSYIETVNPITFREFTSTITFFKFERPLTGFSYLYEIEVGSDKFALVSAANGSLHFVHNSTTYSTGMTVPEDSFQLSVTYRNGNLTTHLDLASYSFSDITGILASPKLFSFAGVSATNPTYSSSKCSLSELLFFNKELTQWEMQYLKRNPRMYEYVLQNNSIFDFSEGDMYSIKNMLSSDFIDVMNSIYAWYDGANGPENLYQKTVDDNNALRQELLGITDTTSEFFKIKNGTLSVTERTFTDPSVSDKTITSSFITPSTVYVSYENSKTIGYSHSGSKIFDDNSVQYVEDLFSFQDTLFARRKSLNSSYNIVMYNAEISAWTEFSFNGFSNINIVGSFFFFEMNNSLYMFMNNKTYQFVITTNEELPDEAPDDELPDTETSPYNPLSYSFVDVSQSFPNEYVFVAEDYIVDSSSNLIKFGSGIAANLTGYQFPGKIIKDSKYFIYRNNLSNIIFYNGTSFVNHRSLSSEVIDLANGFENSYIVKTSDNAISFTGLENKLHNICSGDSTWVHKNGNTFFIHSSDVNHMFYITTIDSASSIAYSRNKKQIDADNYAHPIGNGYEHIPEINDSNSNKFLKSVNGKPEFSDVSFTDLIEVPLSSDVVSGIVSLDHNASDDKTKAASSHALSTVKTIAENALSKDGGTVNGPAHFNGGLYINGIKITIEV